MNGGAIDVSLTEVAASLVLVVIAVAISRRRRAGLEEDIGIAVVRSFVQLTAIGFVITAIFDVDSLLLVVALLAVMVGFGAFTARGSGPARTRRPDAAADRAGALGDGDARPGPGARHLPGNPPLPGPGRRHGDRQRDDRLGGRPQPPR